LPPLFVLAAEADERACLAEPCEHRVQRVVPLIEFDAFGSHFADDTAP
jgi:hypothetical protein